MPSFEESYLLYPRGPRYGLGYAVPVHQRLLGPMRPTRRHVQISPFPVYTERLRCAGAPRRPTSGSMLSPTALFRHVVLNVPGGTRGCMYPVPSPRA